MNAPRVRLLAPMSGSVDDSLRPRFRWSGYQGTVEGTVEVCRDRPCRDVIASFDGQAGEARPEAPLPAGALFWRVLAGGQPTATWQITIPHRESGRPIAFASVPDYNGDGLADVTLGTPTPNAGLVSIFYGVRGYDGHPGIPALAPDVTLEGAAGFGCGVAAIGDTNGDGFTDLGVASGCTGSGSGAVTIYLGSPTGPVRGPGLSAGPVTAGFGTSLASAGDVNGDGYGDAIAGGLEVAQVFLGGPTGLATAAAFGLARTGSAPATGVQGPGDVNGDGLPDVLVTSGIDFGDIYLGTGSGFVLQDVSSPGGNGFGFAGDANGDGYEDFNFFGLMPGSPTGVDSSQFLDIQPAMPFYAAAGDINGDGFFDEIRLIGQVTNFPEHYRITFGQDTPCRQTICLPFVPFGTPGMTTDDFAIIAGIGDTNGDGFDDLVASRPSIGEAYFYLGGPGFPGSPARTWTGSVGFAASVPSLYGTAAFFGVP